MKGSHLQNVIDNGYTVIENVYTQDEILAVLGAIGEADTGKDTFRKSAGLFAIRQFLKEVPEAAKVIFNDKLKALIHDLFGEGYFVVKSIYFDKPEESNWFVAWHQDLTISVDKKVELPGFGPWTVKQNQFAVQPPLNILEDNFTIRIHLDDADEGNGALKVVAGSHLKGVYRPDAINWHTETEAICCVKAGGIMVMRPLLLHASNRTTNSKPRKVVHIELSKTTLPKEINWAEKAEC